MRQGDQSQTLFCFLRNKVKASGLQLGLAYRKTVTRNPSGTLAGPQKNRDPSGTLKKLENRNPRKTGKPGPQWDPKKAGKPGPWKNRKTRTLVGSQRNWKTGILVGPQKNRKTRTRDSSGSRKAGKPVPGTLVEPQKNQKSGTKLLLLLLSSLYFLFSFTWLLQYNVKPINVNCL